MNNSHGTRYVNMYGRQNEQQKLKNYYRVDCPPKMVPARHLTCLEDISCGPVRHVPLLKIGIMFA
jgi:hypothetical protein